MKYLIAIIALAVCCIVVPINGQTAGEHPNAQHKNGDKEKEIPPNTVNVDTVNVNKLNVQQQTEPGGKPGQDSNKSPSYLYRLIQPETLPNAILCLIAIAGIVVAIFTLCGIKKQAALMEGQLGEMRTNNAVVVSKERARIRLIVDKVNLSSDKWAFVACGLINDGPTEAFIDEFGGQFLKADNVVKPRYDQCRRFAIGSPVRMDNQIVERNMIPLEPSPELTADDVTSVNNGKSVLHFIGFVRYRSIFPGQKIRVNVHLRWRVDRGGNGQIAEWWEPIGTPEENGEAEENSPN